MLDLSLYKLLSSAAASGQLSSQFLYDKANSKINFWATAYTCVLLLNMLVIARCMVCVWHIGEP